MGNIEFKTNPNVLLFHCIDHASCWDFHVGDHQRNFLNQLVKINKEDEKLLEIYKEQRKPLGWEEESKLFAWAFSDLKETEKYKDFGLVIKHFSDRKVIDLEITLQEYFSQKSKFIEDFAQKLNSEKPYLKHADTVDKILEIFPMADKNLSLDCYLPYTNSVYSVEGGANGKDIFLEINESSDLSTNGNVVTVALHEYFHKAAYIREYLKTGRGAAENKLFSEYNEALHSDNAGMFDEAVAHVVSELVLDDVDLENMLSGIEQNSYRWFVYKYALTFYPIIKDYLNGEFSNEKCLESLIKMYR